jgi:hypothetical protein
MFGIFKGEQAAMLNLECTPAKTNLPAIRLRKFFERNKYGILKMSVYRTVPSDLFDCRQKGKKYFVFNYLEIKNYIICALAQFLIRKNSLKNRRRLWQD